MSNYFFASMDYALEKLLMCNRHLTDILSLVAVDLDLDLNCVQSLGADTLWQVALKF